MHDQDLRFSGFDWDHGNKTKCQKHGVLLIEIEGLFADTVFISPDLRHSDEEERLQAFGTTKRGRKLLITFTLRHKNGRMLIRPISARYMHKKEIAYYEKETPKTEK